MDQEKVDGIVINTTATKIIMREILLNEKKNLETEHQRDGSISKEIMKIIEEELSCYSNQ